MAACASLRLDIMREFRQREASEGVGKQFERLRLEAVVSSHLHEVKEILELLVVLIAIV